jgi:thioesterase domain-containing protein/malonyl CoA-acyl carrier protein transacylase
VTSSQEFAAQTGDATDRLPPPEATLAGLWAEVLKVPEVGLDDDYFALGGNSLLAASLMAGIETRFGVKLPLSSIIEAPTVAQFARLMDSRGSHRPLVVIKNGGDKTPLFLVHDADGETMLYRGLALHLDPDQTVYGLKPSSKANHPILHTHIEEMAAYHIGTIKTVQERGPYLLGGLCAGGLIAFEMARQLERNGDEVAMVALMDAADVVARGKPLRASRERLTRLAATLEDGKGHSLPQRILGTSVRMLAKARNFTAYVLKNRAAMVRDQAKMRLFRLHLNRGIRLSPFLEHISVRTAYNFARRVYRPATPFAGELVLIRATSGDGDDEPYTERYVDALLGWGPRTTRGVRVFDVPGGHSSMLQEPNVRVMAEFLVPYMNEVLDSPPTQFSQLARPNSSGLSPMALADAATRTDRRAAQRDSNQHEVVVDAERAKPFAPSRPLQLLVVSAESREAMEQSAARLAEHLDQMEDGELADVSDASALERPVLPWRRAVVAESRQQASERLREGTGKGVWNSIEPVQTRPVAFVLAGVGEQTAGAGKGLYEGEPVFRAAADECAEVLRPLLGLDVRETMFKTAAKPGNFLRGDGGVIKDTRVAQPAAFVLDWALAQMWLSWGVKPSAVLGYSVGEFAAAALAGILRLEDALMMVARRAQWIEEMALPGAMLAVPLTAAEILPRLGGDIWIAAVNSPQATVIGGREAAIAQLEEELKRDDVASRRVASDQGSHTPLLEPVRPHLTRLAEGMSRRPPQVPMLSNVTGSWLSASEAQDANHWAQHMCGTLRFEQGIGELLKSQEQVLLEVGPGAGLGAMVRQHPFFTRERTSRVLASLPGAWDRIPEREHVTCVLARLWVDGVNVDWRGYQRTVSLEREPSRTPLSSISHPSSFPNWKSDLLHS